MDIIEEKLNKLNKKKLINCIVKEKLNKLNKKKLINCIKEMSNNITIASWNVNGIRTRVVDDLDSSNVNQKDLI